MKSKKEPKKKKKKSVESTDGSYYADETYDNDGDVLVDDEWGPDTS